jgi:hypothetical protein
LTARIGGNPHDGTPLRNDRARLCRRRRDARTPRQSVDGRLRWRVPVVRRRRRADDRVPEDRWRPIQVPPTGPARRRVRKHSRSGRRRRSRHRVDRYRRRPVVDLRFALPRAEKAGQGQAGGPQARFSRAAEPVPAREHRVEGKRRRARRYGSNAAVRRQGKFTRPLRQQCVSRSVPPSAEQGERPRHPKAWWSPGTRSCSACAAR